MFSTNYTHEQVAQYICDAVIESTAGFAHAVTLTVLEEDRVHAIACAERHEHNNRKFAHQPKFFRGKRHFATIVRGYLGEIVIRRALGLPYRIDDLVFDKPQKRPDLMELYGYRLCLDMKTTEDGTARINKESHFNGAKRPFAYLIADVRQDDCHLWLVDADAVDKWDDKEYPSPHFLRALPEPPVQ